MLFFKISRLRFWPYLFGPFLIGIAAAPFVINEWLLLLFGLYFTLPANLLIYGINDIFDYETDRINPKKQTYEALVSPQQYKRLSRVILLLNAPVIALLLVSAPVARWAMLGFFFFGLFYSMPPIRAKTKPLIDSFFNILYIFPGLVSFGVITNTWPPLQIIVAATLWCMAMHAYSAIPDIPSDKKAGVNTIATLLGKRGTLVFCLTCYLLAAILSFYVLGWFSVVGGVVYTSMMLLSISKLETFSLYKLFPSINLVIGTALFFWIVLVVK